MHSQAACIASEIRVTHYPTCTGGAHCKDVAEG